jgi:hypothetical protein
VSVHAPSRARAGKSVGGAEHAVKQLDNVVWPGIYTEY